MLKIFRKVRQNMLETGKTARYLKYAIGEIILVMIGILLALQVNNWNELKKAERQEVKILNQINNDLKVNLEEVGSVYDRVIRKAHMKDSILHYLTDPNRYKPELRLLLHEIQFAGGVFNKTNTTFKYIENEGINIFSNDTIRANITLMYDRYLSNIEYRQQMELDRILNHLEPLIYDSFVPDMIDDRMPWPIRDVDVLNFPKEPSTLVRNQKFINVLVKLQEIILLRKHALEVTTVQLEALIEEIENEIERIEN